MRDNHIRLSADEREKLENFVSSKGIDPDALAYGEAVRMAVDAAMGVSES